MPVNSFDDYYMSWKPNIKNATPPIYKALAEILENDIKSGKLKPGTKLPPQRELADFLDINLSTVSRSIKLVMEKGLLSSSIGSGTFVSSDADINTVILLENNNEKIIEMGAILPDVLSNKLLVSYMEQLVKEQGCEKYFQYSMPDDSKFYRETAVKWFNMNNLNVNNDENILFSAGGQNGITAVLASLFKSGDKIGTNKFIYPGLKTIAKMLGIQVIPIEEENNEITKEGLIYACKNEKIKGLYLIPDYSNPTTHSISDKGRRDIAEVAKSFDLIVIEDAINSMLKNEKSIPIAEYAKENTIYISSLSKTIAPGLRLSYIYSPKAYYEKIKTALYNINIAVSPLLVEMASRIINSRDLEKIISIRKKQIKDRNKIFNKYLSDYKVLGEEQCPFRWLILPEYFTGKSFELCAKKFGVKVYSSERFAVGGRKLINAVRIAVTSAKSNEEFEKGIKIIKNLLENNDEIDTLL